MKVSKFVSVFVILALVFNISAGALVASPWDENLSLAERIDAGREEIREVDADIFELIEQRRLVQQSYESNNELFTNATEELLYLILVMGANLLTDTLGMLVSNFGCDIAAKMLEDYRADYEEAASRIIRARRTLVWSARTLELLDDHIERIGEEYEELVNYKDDLEDEVERLLQMYKDTTGVHYAEHRSPDTDSIKSIRWSNVTIPEDCDGHLSPQSAANELTSNIRSFNIEDERFEVLFDTLINTFDYTISEAELIDKNSAENVYVYESLAVPPAWDGRAKLLETIRGVAQECQEALEEEDYVRERGLADVLRLRREGTFRIEIRVRVKDLNAETPVYVAEELNSNFFPKYIRHYNSAPQVENVEYDERYLRRGQTAVFKANVADEEEDNIRQVSWFLANDRFDYYRHDPVNFKELGEGIVLEWDIPTHFSAIRNYINIDWNRTYLVAVAEDVHGGISEMRNESIRTWSLNESVQNLSLGTYMNAQIEPEETAKDELTDLFVAFTLNTPGSVTVSYRHLRKGGHNQEDEFISSGSVDAVPLHVLPEDDYGIQGPFMYGFSIAVFPDGFNSDDGEIFARNAIEFEIENRLGGELIAATSEPQTVVFDLSDEHIEEYRDIMGARLRDELAVLTDRFNSAVFPLDAAKVRAEDLGVNRDYLYNVSSYSGQAAAYSEYYVDYLTGNLSDDFYGPPQHIPENTSHFLDRSLRSFLPLLELYGESTEVIEEAMEGSNFRDDIFYRMSVYIAYRDILCEYNNYWQRFEGVHNRASDILEEIKEVTAHLRSINQEYDVDEDEKESRLELPSLPFWTDGFINNVDRVEDALTSYFAQSEGEPITVDPPLYTFEGDGIDPDDPGEKDEDKEVWYGDVTGSGDITVADSIYILRHIVGLVTLAEDQIARSKVSGNNELSVSDAILVLRYIVGLINEFPAETNIHF